jgi:hypothetical protein
MGPFDLFFLLVREFCGKRSGNAVVEGCSKCGRLAKNMQSNHSASQILSMKLEISALLLFEFKRGYWPPFSCPSGHC